MAKKPYSLDYSIERDTDRLKAVEEILDTLPSTPTARDCELFASYILYGKDEDGKNALERKETYDSNEKRYRTYKHSNDRIRSLDAILDNPLADHQALYPLEKRQVYCKRQFSIKRPHFDKDGNKIDNGDGDIPGMEELWVAIDRTQRLYDMSVGKIPPDETTKLVEDTYRQYQLKHQLIDMRRHQYLLKDSYHPIISFQRLVQPQPQTCDWSQDSAYWITHEEWEKRTQSALSHTVSRNIEDYETDENGNVKWVVRHHHFDWENPRHIQALINYYSRLYMELYDKPMSWGRTLIYDFDRYYDMCNFPETWQFMLLKRIDGASYSTIAEEIRQNFNLSFNEAYLCEVIISKIPTQMANAARRHRLLLETPKSELKRCWTCKKLLPRDYLFFGSNAGRADKLSSNCKECEKRKRDIERGTTVDGRRKKAPVS